MVLLPCTKVSILIYIEGTTAEIAFIRQNGTRMFTQISSGSYQPDASFNVRWLANVRTEGKLAMGLIHCRGSVCRKIDPTVEQNCQLSFWD